MTAPRRLIVNPTEVGWYHCVSRCVRRAYLCGDGHEHRKGWVVERLRLLAEVFAVEIAAYAVMSNHLHVVVRLDPSAPQGWPAEDVARRWLTVYGPCAADGSPQAPDPALVTAAAQDWAWVAARRRRLGELGWFMKSLKEPIARRANREDGVTGHFWEGRFRSTALLDEAAVIACMAYVDLNPIRARMADRPEASNHTSIQARIHARQYHETLLKRNDAAASSEPPTAADPEAGLWLWHFEHPRHGLCQTMRAAVYLNLVDATGRCLRADKRGAITDDLAAILRRLDLDVGAWLNAMAMGRQMRGTGLGHITARAVEARRRGTGWVANRSVLFAGERAA